MEKFGKFLLFFVTCVFLSSLVYIYSIDKVLPKIEYANKVSFQLAFLNYDDLLIVAFKENDTDKEHSLAKYSLKKSNYLQDFYLELPYQYSKSLFFLFGESQPINFAIANIFVNGKYIEPKLIQKELELIGYKTVEHNSVIYAEHKENVTMGALNVYHMSDAFVHLNNEELSNYNEQDSNTRMIYFLLLFFINFIVLYLVIKKTIKSFKSKYLLVCCVLLYLILFVFSYIFTYFDKMAASLVDVVYLFKNYLFIILLPIVAYCFSCCYSNKLFKVFICIITVSFLVLIGIDNFVQNVFGTRFLYNYVGKFGGNVKDGIPFLIDYISNFSGLYFILMILSCITIFTVDCAISKKFKNINILLFIIFLFSISLTFIGNSSDKHRFFNVFQVNINGLFTDGNYKRQYENYKTYALEQLEYKNNTGLNQKKNIIVILVESLGCNVTDLCGTDKNYSPYTKKLAQDNIWFPNYYSNAYHTNGAIFAITTGYTLIASDFSDRTPYNEKLYQYDLINKFKENGYKTAYFSPAPLILGKDKQLKMSNYDYVSFNSDKFYDNSKKNGVFYSATDEELFAKIMHDLKLSKKPVFFMTTTISTHTPYIVPWGAHKIETAYAYSDMAIRNFIKKLEEIKYFDDGIVVITGDHVGWASNNSVDTNTLHSKIGLHKVPLIIINGHDHGMVIDDVSFSHTSLGVMLEYLMLPVYSQNRFQINPLVDHNSSEYIIHYDDAKINVVDVKYGDKEDEILLDGDQTRFEGSSFSKYEQDLILGYLSWMRQ